LPTCPFGGTISPSPLPPRQIFLLDGLVCEVSRVRGLKALLDVRDAAQREFAAAWTAHDKLTFQDKSFRDKGRADKADAMAPKIAEAKALMTRMKERLDDISKGILNVEADRLARTRVHRIISMTGQYAALSIASGVRSQELWTSFLGTMGLDQSVMVSDAQRTLVGTMSMHTLDAVGPAVTYVAPSAFLDASTPAIIPNAVTPDGSAAAGSDGSVPAGGAAGGAGASTTPAAGGAGGGMAFTAGGGGIFASAGGVATSAGGPSGVTTDL